MSSLKEIKNRLASVRSTLKITTAMKMVASAKLHRSQVISDAFKGYYTLLKSIVSSLYDGSEDSLRSALHQKHEKRKKVIVVAVSSDSSLCGAFNSNIAKALALLISDLEKDKYESVKVFAIGEKIYKEAKKAKYDVEKVEAETLASKLMTLYTSGEVDSVMMVYNHFQSMGRQIPTRIELLPLSLSTIGIESLLKDSDQFILEPKREDLLEELLPTLFRSYLNELILDSAIAEHAARSVAMQTATDNAEDMLDELSLTYNKSRQKAITEELSDIAHTE